MVLSLKELRRYIHSAYPQYTLRVYVPPSNVLSPEGRDAVKEAFPEIKVFSSLYSGSYSEVISYFQDYERLDDGTYDIPRVSSGFVLDDTVRWNVINVINARGIFSHFVHPDQIFYENSAHLTWSDMSRGFKEIVEYIADNFGWLRAATASEATEHMDVCFDAEYSTLFQEGKFTIYAENTEALKAYYVLRTSRPLKNFSGCSVQKIGETAYLVTMADNVATITLENEPNR
jgi:hypothetical protein